MALVDEAWWTVLEYIFIVIFVIFILVIFIMVRFSDAWVIGWFIDNPIGDVKTAEGTVSYKYTQLSEKGYSTAFSISRLRIYDGIDDRTFLEHSLYYIEGSLQDEDDIDGCDYDKYSPDVEQDFITNVCNLMMRYDVPFRVLLEKKYEIENDKDDVNTRAKIPLFYKDTNLDIQVFIENDNENVVISCEGIGGECMAGNSCPNDYDHKKDRDDKCKETQSDTICCKRKD